MGRLKLGWLLRSGGEWRSSDRDERRNGEDPFTLATPEPTKDWSLTGLKEKLIKIGAKLVSHGRYVAFQMAEVAIPRTLFAEVMRPIAELRPQPPPAPS